MPVIGYLSALSEGQAALQLAGFSPACLNQGQNVSIEFRWADGLAKRGRLEQGL
jgi:hypothetical protein